INSLPPERREEIMTRFIVGGKSIDLPAIKVPQADSDKACWRGGEFITIKFDREFYEAVRAHTDGREFPNRSASFLEGKWILIGDVILTSGQIVDSRSLPGEFTRVANVVVPAGCVANIGVTSSLLAGSGGGMQAEYVSGPAFQFRPMQNKYWHGRAGRA